MPLSHILSEHPTLLFVAFWVFFLLFGLEVKKGSILRQMHVWKKEDHAVTTAKGLSIHQKSWGEEVQFRHVCRCLWCFRCSILCSQQQAQCVSARNVKWEKLLQLDRRRSHCGPSSLLCSFLDPGAYSLICAFISFVVFVVVPRDAETKATDKTCR